MKKRVLSMLMALVLCLTLLPTAALADELGPVDGTSTVETAGADAEAEAKAKAGAEAVAAVQAMIDALPEEITADDADIADALAAIEGEMAALSEDQRATLDVSRYEAALAALEGQADEAEQDADESENADADDTEQGTASDDNYTPSESGGTAEVDKLPSPVQAMIDALPDALTEENAGDVSAMLGEIDAAMAALGDEERAALDLTQYQAVIAALAALAAAQGEIALYADENNEPKGDGTEEHPYQITSTDELEWFRDTVNEGNAEICAELMDDLNFPEVNGWTWTPIGKDTGKAYTGTFNGNGYKITMKYAVAPGDMTAGWGLFGSIGNDGKVQDLDIYLSNFGWKGNAFSISESGMLAAYNSGTIERCTAMSGKINVSNGVGLLVYQNDGTIQDCWTKLGTVIDEGKLIGGVAYTNNGKIKNCFFNGGYKDTYLNNHTIAIEKGNSGSIANCYFILLNGKYTDDTNGVTGVAQADANSGKLTVKLNNNGDERGSKVDPWRIDSGTINRYPSLKKTDYRVSYDSKTDGYEKGDPPHMHGNVEFTKVNALSDIKADGNYYISGAIKLDSTWEVNKKVLLCLDGQTITAASGVDPAIKIVRGGSLTLVDGSKTGGGKITGGATGVMLDGSAFTMQGGIISGNTVGVHVKSGDLTLGGKAQVTGNDKNILLAVNQKIHFDSLDPSAKFGIFVEGQENLNDRVAVTDATGGQYFGQLVADGFKDNGVGFELYLSDDGKTVMLGKQSAHTHCICGGRNTNLGHTSHSDVTFQPWRETDKLPTSGNYYLTRNVTLTKNATLQNANVCLNGYTVTLSNVGRINPSGTTQLTDCSVNGKLESYPGKANGGVTISNGNTFCLYGGTLNGVKVEIGQTGGGTFNMYGGKITGNTQGTVVGQSKTSNKSTITINMYGGEISGNNISENQGGGVFVGSGNQFNMYGGTVQNNSAVDGGGVYVASAENAYSAGTMTICGDAVIQGNNKAGGVTNNVSLPSGKTITISGKLGKNANIGVTTRANLSQGNVNIATATDTDWVAAKNFTSDKSAYHVGLVNDGKTVQLQVHSHQWGYSVSQDGTTITAKCTAENCDLADSNGGSVQIVQPTGLIYDGAEKTATVNKSQDWRGEAVDASKIVYTKEGDDTFIGKPKDAGTYTASITVGGVTASVKYTIAQAELTIDSVTVTSKTYNGSADAEITNVTFTGLKNSEALTKGKDYEVSGTFNSANVNEANKVTGTVTLKDTSKVKNYKLPITTYDVSATIAQAATPAAPTGLTGVKDQLLSTLSLAAHPGWSWADGTVSMSTAGSQDFNANYHDSNGNYADGTNVPVSVNVVNKTDTGVTITGLPQTVTYGDAFTLEAAQTGDTGTSGKWSWDFDGDYFQEKSTGGHQETLTLQAIKAGTSSKGITATYESGTHKGSATVNAVVEKKEVTVSGITAANKEYNGNNTATVNASGATITGKVDGDKLTITATGTFADADAGENKTVTLTLGTLGGADSANYTLATAGNQTETKANITAKDVSISAVTVSDKDYSGNANATVASVTITGVSGALSMGTDFDVTSATFPDADADTANVDVTINVALKDTAANNYNLTNGMGYVVTSAAKINKAAYGGAAPTKTVNILKNYAGVQTGTLTAADFFTTAPAEAKITNAVPNADFRNMMSIAGADTSSGNFTYASKTNITAASDASWTVTISSKNYTDITTAELIFKLVDKTDVNAQITFPNGTLTYNGAGQKYEKATISGVSGGTWNYTYVANSGTGASLDSAGLPKTAGTYTVTAKYEDDAHIGTKPATLTVSKATPTGAPTCTKITTSSKTLADAPLAIGTIAPAGGTLAWDMPASTVVAANTAYNWTYTPADTANYKALTGSLTPYAVSYGGGGGGGSSAATPSVSDKVAKELKNAKEGSTVAIDMKGETKLPASVTKEIAGKDVTVELDMGGGTVWSFNGLDVPKGGVRLDLGVKTGTKTIPAKVINALTGEATTIQLQLDHNGPFGMSLKLSVDLGKKHDGLYANLYFYNPKSGELEFQSASMISGGKASWVFDHASDYAIVIDKESHEPMTFTDVPDTAYYAEAVNWAVAKKITEGVGNKLFGSNDPCTRAQIVTFLWRAAGSPGPKTMSGFSDVPADSYYAKAVAWAVENGITGGTGDGKFSPDATCTRAQAVTFLYRASGAPAVSGNAAFSDVATNAYYAAAVKWAEKNGITGGIGGGLFGSDNNCTRAQIVTFLYRSYQSK